jgi:Autotransporter beta-domain
VRVLVSYELPISARRILNVRNLISLLAFAGAASLMMASTAQAGCTDTFQYYFEVKADPAASPPIPAVPPTPLQHAVPLGVGSSLNALMSTMKTVNTAFLSPSSAFVWARGGAAPEQLGGGVWGRTVAGAVDSTSKTTAKLDLAQTTILVEFNGKLVPQNLNASFIDPGLTRGTGVCEGKLHEDYYGYQFGFDLAKFNIGGEGANVHIGLTAGYFNSKTKDTTAANEYTKQAGFFEFDPTVSVTINSPAGSFRAEGQVPFIGLYGALTNGNFFADALIRQDFYLMTFNDPLNGLSNQAQNAYGLSAAANIGYKIQLPMNWFIEPSGGALWSRVRVDNINSPGGAFFSGLNAGTVKVDDIESILGRATVRVGTTFTTSSLVWQPFLVGTIFHEFADNATATSHASNRVEVTTQCGANPQITCKGPITSGPFAGIFEAGWDHLAVRDVSTSTTRIGTFAQYGIGTALVFGNSGWLGYGRFDYRTGENIEGYSVNAGLRYNW